MRLGTGTGLSSATDSVAHPSDMSGLVCFCEADDVVYSNGLFIERVNDKSGNYNHLLQSTLTRQPQQVRNAINGQPLLHFDGVDDSMSAGFSLEQSYTRILVYKLWQWVNIRTICSGKINAHLLQTITAIPQVRMLTTGAPIGTINSDVGQLLVVTQIFGMENSLFKKNRDGELLGNVANTIANGVTIGSTHTVTNISSIDFAGLAIYNRALSDAEILTCIKYFENKYGIRYDTNKYVSKYKPPSAWANDPAAFGDQAWVSMDKSAVSDNVYATVSLGLSPFHSSQVIKATGFGFAIPSTATITGIMVEVQVKADVASAASDQVASVLKVNDYAGDDQAAAVTIGTAKTTKIYGSPTFLFGTTWTPADINNSGFGFGFAVGTDGVSSATVVGIDLIRISVWYTDVTINP